MISRFLRHRGRTSTVTAVLALAGMLATAAPAAAQGTLEAAFTVLGSDGAIARAVLSGADACPPLSVDGTPQPMQVRARPDTGPQARFPVLVCEAAVPAGAATLAVGLRALPPPPSVLRRLVVIGDTGCRLKGKSVPDPAASDDDGTGKFQDCDDPADWPFAAIAARAAGEQPDLVVPDLVIHVGDYIYRESPCPAGDKGCAGSPWGDSWVTWKADVFAPAAPLLAAAPWIAMRGNHEICSRAGAGYLRFLHPVLASDGVPPACTDLLAPYTVAVSGRSFVVLDTSAADDECPAKGCNSAPYAAQLATLAPPPGSWLLSHRPVWGIKQKGMLNQALQGAVAATGGRLPTGIALVVSGHMHIFETLSFADGGPPQLVVGMSGTALEHAVERKLDGMTVGGRAVAHGFTRHRFGFLRMEPEADGWRGAVVSTAGNPLADCTLGTGSLNCR